LAALARHDLDRARRLVGLADDQYVDAFVHGLVLTHGEPFSDLAYQALAAGEAALPAAAAVGDAKSLARGPAAHGRRLVRRRAHRSLSREMGRRGL
jgi:hypothetical protein